MVGELDPLTRHSASISNRVINTKTELVGDPFPIIQSANTSIPVLAGGSYSAGAGFQLSVTGEIGREYRLQTIANMTDTNWIDLFAFTNTATAVQLLDPQATNFTRRFYRAVSP